MRTSLSLRLFFTIWVIFVFHFNPNFCTSSRFVYVAMALSEQCSIRTDGHYDDDSIIYKGHSYISTNPGLSFMAAPFWVTAYHLIYRWLPKTSFLSHDTVHFLLACFVSFVSTSALYGALTALLLALFIYKRTQKLWRALLGASIYAFGSIAFCFSASFNQNIAIALFSFLIFVFIFEPEIIPVRKSNIRLIILGFIIGLAIFIDLSILPFLLVMSMPILKRMHSFNDAGRIILGALGPLLALMLYLYLAFGNAFLPPQSYMGDAYKGSICWVTLPRLKLLIDHLVTPKSGVFLYMPFTILSIWYIIKFWNKHIILGKEEKNIIVLIFLIYLLYVSSVKASIFNIFGPRYMFPTVPFLCLLFALYVGIKESAIAVLLAGASFLINIGGAQLGSGTGNIFVHFAAFMSRGPWLPILNWEKENASQLTGYTPEILTPYGLFLLMFVY